MPLDQVAQLRLVGFGDDLFQIHHAEVAAGVEEAVLVIHIGDAAAHARREIQPGPSQHGHAPAGHILAPVVADAFDDRARPAVADGEALARAARDKRLAARRAVEEDIARDGVGGAGIGDTGRRPDHDASAR